MSDDELRSFEVMTRGPFAALFHVPEDGFSWRDGLLIFDQAQGPGNEPGRWLLRRGDFGTPYTARRYSPLAVPNLHRRFARLEPSYEAILAFANTYGFLGHTSALRDPELQSQAIKFGESLHFWQNEVAQMAALLAVWELVRLNRSNALSQVVRWTSPGRPRAVIFYYGLISDLAQTSSQAPITVYEEALTRRDPIGQASVPHFTMLAYEEKAGDAELLNRWQFGDPLEPARYYVHREVNKRLKDHVSPAVLPYRKGEIYFFPDCLLSALYTLFMLELSGRQRPPILCARQNCGRYFEPVHGRQRYCETRCQQLAYYYRKKGKKQTK